jgi:hypothetical protein
MVGCKGIFGLSGGMTDLEGGMLIMGEINLHQRA